MKHRCIVTAAAVVAILFGGVGGAAQSIDFHREEGPAPPITRLERYGIAIDKASLVEALHHQNSSVRWLAAWALAQEGALDTLPELVYALSTEAEPITKLNIAAAIAQLGDNRGLAALRNLCNSANTEYGLKIRAAENLLRVKNEDCLDQVMDVIQVDDDYRESALALLLRFQHVSLKQGRLMVRLARQSLSDDNPGVRVRASQLLAGLNDVTSIPELTAAFASEQNDMVRTQFEADLKRLQGLKK